MNTSEIEEEKRLLGTVMLDPTALDRSMLLLRAEHFWSAAHRRIFEVCTDLRSGSKRVGSVEVACSLRERDLLSEIGGMPYLAELFLASRVPADVLLCGQNIRERWRLRHASPSAGSRS